MGAFSIWHWLIVLVVVALVFGTKKLRNVGGDLGGAIKGFKDALNEEKTATVLERAEEPSPVIKSNVSHKESQ